MKLDFKIITSMLVGAALIFLLMPNNTMDSSFIRTVNAAETTKFPAGDLTSCEVFFSEARDSFEDEINSRLKKARLLQSNVIWSETTKQIGFYALICY